MAKLFRSSRPDSWTAPRPFADSSVRYMNHGPIQPMYEPTWLERLLGQR